MKLKLTLLAMLISSSSAFAGITNGMEKHSGEYYVGGDVGVYIDDNDSNGEIYGIKGGYQFSETIGFEGGYEFVDPEGSSEHVDSVNLNVLYYPLESTHGGTYVKAGVIYNQDGSKTRGSVGIGRQLFITDNFSINPSLGYQFDDHDNDAVIKVGFNYYFGNKKEVVKNAPIRSNVEEVKLEKKEIKIESKTIKIKHEYKMKVGFEMGKTEVAKSDLNSISSFAEKIKDIKDKKIEIIGFSSRVGNKEYNQALSLKRAEAVKDVLVNEYKIDPDYLIAKGMGVPVPNSENPSEDQKVEASVIVVELIN